jgi:hypothetical protein
MYNDKMIKQRNTFFLGIFILITWIFFGVPTSWKIFITIVSALYLVIISVKITLPKRNLAKRIKKKEKVTPVFMENSPIYPPAPANPNEPADQNKPQ